MKEETNIFEIGDQKLYSEISKHPKCAKIISTVSTNNKKKQFKYLYVDEPKYVLGQGSFGRVLVCFYEGEEMNVKLALKIIKVPQEYEQIKTIEHIVATSRQQILALIKLRQNKHIIQIEDIIRNNNQIFIMLQFCNERDLNYYFHKINKENKINRQFHVRFYFAQILNAFKELHKYNFMHRDIKPSNILVHNGVLKVADFGLARQIFQEQRQSFEEHVGTMITAAPQIVFKQEYTNKCDIYSLGVILYWMIYQRYPFQRIPTKEDFLYNKLVFPKCQYFDVTDEMIKLLKHMLAYQESNRINWVELLNHELFQSAFFAEQQEKIKQYYENLQVKKMRQTYGRHFVKHVSSDDLFLETTLPTSYYKFIREIDGEEQFNKIMMEERNSFRENSPLHAHKIIKDQFRNQHIRIKFYRTLILELESLEVDLRRSKKQSILIMKLLLYCLQKYTIYRMSKIKDQLVYVIPPSIFNIKHLKQAEEEPIHKDFLEYIAEKIKGSEFQIRTKFTIQNIKKLKQQCEEFKILGQLTTIFDEINERSEFTFLSQVQQCILEMIYFIKPQIQKMNMRNKENKNFYPYKTLILCVHHLFMFVMKNQIFPKNYNPDFPYGTFLEKEQFKSDKNFQILNEKVLDILDRFQ